MPISMTGSFISIALKLVPRTFHLEQFKIRIGVVQNQKGPYDNFMQKEIYEQCETTKMS